jgi:hypothetical protein
LIFLALITASFSPSAHAWSQDGATVKVESYFQKGSENKLEGSGFLIYYQGWKVVTSEHVVLPGNDPVVHKVTTGEGYVMDAVWEKSNWDKGLALLRIVKKHPNISVDYYPELEHIQQYERAYMSGGPDQRLVGPVQSFAVAAGTNVVRASKGSHVGFVPEGDVLGKQDVLSVKGLNTEFGMSGGPVFYGTGNSFFGLMTHITYEESPLTYVIPGYDVLNWITGRVSTPSFGRTVEDFQYQFFSKARGERVHLLSSDITIEKRGKEIFINLPKGYSSYSGGTRFPALDKAVRAMENKGVRVGRVSGAGDITLAQFIGGLSRDYYISWTDAEGAVNGGGDGLTNVPNFVSRGDQSVQYRSVRVNLRTKMVSDIPYGPIHAATVREEKKGWIAYSSSEHGPSGLHLNQCFEGDVNCQGGESISAPSRMASSDWWRDKAAGCEAEGGVMEVVSVPAGKYRACKISNRGETTWYGPIPIYGIVKYEQANGSKGELESVQYAR